MFEPILYSFRRCPYAMRARMAIADAGLKVELREILLRDKAPEFLSISPKGTVPVVVLPDGEIIEESIDVMRWAYTQSDPNSRMAEMPDAAWALIERLDFEFKPKLDRYKYLSRHKDEGLTQEAARDAAMGFLYDLDQMLSDNPYLFGKRPLMADFASFPFIRQFAHVDRDWFYAQDFPHLIAWLNEFLESDAFAAIMSKYPKWQAGDVPTQFPA